MPYTPPTLRAIVIESESATCCGIAGIGPTCNLQVPDPNTNQPPNPNLNPQECADYIGLVPEFVCIE